MLCRGDVLKQDKETRNKLLESARAEFNDNKTDTKFEYLYTFKYPEETVPEDGYEAFSKGMKKENLGYNLDVTILGITEKILFLM